MCVDTYRHTVYTVYRGWVNTLAQPPGLGLELAALHCSVGLYLKFVPLSDFYQGQSHEGGDVSIDGVKRKASIVESN